MAKNRSISEPDERSGIAGVYHAVGMVWLAVRVVVFAVLYSGTFLALIPSWFVGAGQFSVGWARWVGLIPLVIGAFVVVVCIVGFAVRGRGTPAPFDPPRQLVTGWMYGRVRNPIYLGGTLILLGEAIVWQSLALVGYAVGMWLIWHLLVVWYEEPALQRRFGASYSQYRTTVRRWLPSLRSP